jgi:phospholipase/carboxylesterase
MRPYARACLAIALLASTLALTGCKIGETDPLVVIVSDGRVSARPTAAPTHAVPVGLHTIGLATGARDGLLYVPTGYNAAVATPFVVVLHGATRNGLEMIEAMREFADVNTVVLLAPDSRGATWDMIQGGMGPDIYYMTNALTWAFDRIKVDAARVGIAGFSDGASYALTLGRINGDLFTRVAAFSPGLIGNGPHNGTPEFFITHGANDNVLPAGRTRLFIVPELRDQGYTVTYTEFDGGHGVTKALLGEATAWLAGVRP